MQVPVLRERLVTPGAVDRDPEELGFMLAEFDSGSDPRVALTFDIAGSEKTFCRAVAPNIIARSR
jgi:hypothetical protein